jgi:hypothetical protein
LAERHAQVLDRVIWSRALLERYPSNHPRHSSREKPYVVSDWNRLGELFAPAAFVMALWDPPYICNAGDGLVGKASWGARYGTRGSSLRADSMCHLFVPFLASARQVLDPCRGTLVVKVGDQMHHGELQWQPFELRRVALDLGWFACDYQVRVRAQPLDPNWIRQRHVRRGATFWLGFHTGPRCPNPRLDLVRARVCWPQRRSSVSASAPRSDDV